MNESLVRDIIKFRKEYIARYKYYVELSKILESNIINLLDKNNINYMTIEVRVKTIESFIGKIIKKKEKYENPFETMTDIIGIRIISYYIKDTEIISELIKKSFIIDEKNSINKLSVLDYNQFGYRSVHYIIDIYDRNNIGFDLEVVKAEIQIRTLLQHSWAVIDHKLRYKSIVEMPQDLKRKLFRISALLELADEEFENIKNYLSNIENFYLNKFEKGDYNIELNSTSMAVYIKSKSKNLKKFQNTLKKLGLIDTSLNYEEKPIDNFLNLMQMLEINTIKEIDDVLGISEESVLGLKDDIDNLFDDDNKMVFQISNYINIFIFVLLFRGNIDKVKNIKQIKQENIDDIMKMRNIIQKK
ncbi:MAG: hypothetical protein GX287_05540 [Fusobacteria bacterium]|nr:hypothetical protein [Fusobacteriota bacterium]